MFERFLTPLVETLRLHFGLSKTRLETLAVLLVGLANCRTFNLPEFQREVQRFQANVNVTSLPRF